MNMWAVIYYNDGSSSENIYPKDGVSFGKYELAMKDKRIVNVIVYGQ